MDPLQLEIDRYQQERDQLAGQLTEAEAQLADFNLQLAQFEDVFFRAVQAQRLLLVSWEQRCTDTLAIIRHLEQCQWKGEAPPHQILPILESVTQRPLSPPKTPIKLSPDDQKKAKRIYRTLAKRFHPDLVGLPDLQLARKEVMREINAAYQNQDLEALETLQHHPDIRSEENETKGERWERLVREIALIQRKFNDVQQKQAELQAGSLAQAFHRYGLTGKDSRFEPFRMSLLEQVKQLQNRWRRLRSRESQLWLELS
ncbi:MAG: J domain-containing protein [Myxococcota bacterium]|nr:J domain-containing protein [Myxococcota bacterium]